MNVTVFVIFVSFVVKSGLRLAALRSRRSLREKNPREHA
jgi:hypothetical protein